jgi:FAD/FMN-containing dehydrogenase
MRITRRRVLGGVGVAVSGALLARPAAHLALSALHDRSSLPPPRPGFAEDASRLEAVPVEAHALPAEGAEETLRNLVARATSEGRAIAIAGARHTMGGHTFLPNALAVDMGALRSLRLDEERNLLTAGAGALWSDVIPFLDARGRSVAVMQGYSSFSVGGSLGANAHGWQHDRPPLASTVESFRILVADGRVLRASRSENAELFGMVLGGYGLFGVLLDVELRVVANALYSAKRWAVPADRYVDAFERHVRDDPTVAMAYGRLSTSRERFLTEALLTVYQADAAQAPIPRLTESRPSVLARAVFRGSEGSDYGKSLRWDLEKWLGGEAGSRSSRNQILDEPVSLFDNHDPTRTDILHEYFLPPATLAPFVARMRVLISSHGADLLNVTVRSVLRDDDSFLRYADQPMFSLVLLFSIPCTLQADEQMAPLTRALVDAAIDLGGRHYLPYRLHATPAQLARAYPRAREFFAAKRRWDPSLVFRNQFFARYSEV